MGLDSLNIGPRFTGGGEDRLDRARGERRADERQGEANVAESFTANNRSTTDHRKNLATRSEAAAKNAAELARLTRMGQQEPARAAHAADALRPPAEQDSTTQAQQTQPENPATEPSATEQPTPTEQAAAPEPQAAEVIQHDDNLPPPAGEQPADSDHPPVVANAPREASQPQHADNHAQPQHEGEGDPHAGNPQAQRTAQRPTVRRGEQTANPEEGVLTPEQQLARLSRGGVPATRTPPTATHTPQVAPNTPAALLAQGTTAPMPPAPLTQAQEALPQGVVRVFASGGMDPDQTQAYEGLVQSGLKFAQMEQPPSQDTARTAQHAFTAAVVTQQTAQPMTFAGLREARERERRSREGVSGIAPREGRGSQREGELAGLVGRGMYHSVRG